uniref:Helitron helicase-like domain-containing protein n=1 Tax=Tanacetum cinerariifolium TaxID=118510 RepID=A0A6L2M6B0_TANCI|nr:helitron helicase-like domain-containing protein [Tanacetum cinerariifolium]
MKGKRKCDDLNEGLKFFNNIIRHDIWNGGYGTTSTRQQHWRQSLYNGSGLPQNDYNHIVANAGRYTHVGTFHTSGYAEGGVMLDFADPTRHFFWSVSTKGESSRNNLGWEGPLRSTVESVQTFSCAMRDDPTSYLDGCSMGDEYSKRNSTNRGPVILDFENSVVHLPSLMGTSSGFKAVNVMDSSATKTKYPANVDCPSISLLGDTNSIHTNGESSTNDLNGEGHLWPTADFKGPVVLDFENQAIHLPSIVGVSTSFQIANDVKMLTGKNNNPPNIDYLDSSLLEDMNSLHSNGVIRNVDSRRKNMRGREPLPNVTSQGLSSCYIDIGDCDCSCQYCDTKFWYGERVHRSSTYQLLNYHKCCSGGKVRLGVEPHPPQYIRQLFKNRRFMENIRAYNQMFSMTSFGARVEDSINNGRAPYMFKISREVYHWIGSLCPNKGDPPRFLQLYIYDTQNEVANRMRHFGGTGSGNLEEVIVQGLINFLDEHNELVRLFRTTRDKCTGQFVPDFKLRLYSVVGAREYDLPTSETLGGIVFQNSQDTKTDYDVIIRSGGGPPQRNNKLHPSGGRLLQQYVVGVYCCIKNRMYYYRTHQSDIRKDYLSGVYDAISRGIMKADALAICRALGNPRFFVTFTCNVNWPEIKWHMQHYPEVPPGIEEMFMFGGFTKRILVQITRPVGEPSPQADHVMAVNNLEEVGSP